MSAPSFVVALPGWELCWIHLEVTGEGDLAARRERVATRLRAEWTPSELGESARTAGLQPTTSMAAAPGWLGVRLVAKGRGR